MTPETESTTRDGGSGSEYGTDTGLDRLRGRLSTDREPDGSTVVVLAGAVALATVAGTTAIRVLGNLPFDPVAVPGPVRGTVTGGAPLVVGGALLVAAIAARRVATRVGLLFAGAFGVLPQVADAATLPAVVAVSLGGAVALLGTLGVPSIDRSLRRSVVGAGFAAGIALSLAGGTGVVSAGFRAVGGTLAAGSLGAAGIRIEGDRIALVVGGAAFLATAFASAASPYVVGSALVAAFAVVGVPHLLVAAAVGSGVGVAVAALRRREHATAVGAGILLLAGVPATPERAMAVLLGATLVLVDVGTPTPDRGTGTGPENGEVTA